MYSSACRCQAVKVVMVPALVGLRAINPRRASSSSSVAMALRPRPKTCDKRRWDTRSVPQERRSMPGTGGLPVSWAICNRASTLSRLLPEIVQLDGSTAPSSFRTLVFLAGLCSMTGYLGKLESRLAGLERGQADIHETLAHHSVKSDRVDSCMERIEKRLDLIDS